MRITTKVELYADRVQRRIASKKRRVLFKQGAYLKTTLQRMQRYSEKPAPPGKPPHAHRKSGAWLRKGVRFDVDLESESVVSGPELRPQSKVLSNKPLPQLQDQGGVTEGIGGERIQIAPHPFIAPVFSDGGNNFRQLIERESL